MQQTEPAAPAELAGEERARADAYALVARLFYAPPDPQLLHALAATPDPARAGHPDTEPGATTYERAFAALRATCRGADAAALQQAYDDLFVGTGRAAVTPYTSAYAAPHAPERHLVALRERLSGWGLARRPGVFEFEDHVSALCDTMRWLIVRARPLAEQRAFFDAFVDPGVGGFCGAVQSRAAPAFYAAAAQLARALLTVEREGFDLDTAGVQGT